MSQPAVATDALERRFGENHAVAGIDLDVPAGEVYGFLGPNGAGKSTTVRILCTLLRPTGGSARVAGFDVDSDPAEVRLRIGVALQEASLDDRQTGREVLQLQGRLYGLARADLRRRVDDVIGMVDISEAIDGFISTYSGGMRRRLDLAAALVHEPQVVFLDEPTTGLDPASRVVVWEEIRRLNREAGTTIFLTTQYLTEADELCDRVGIIDAGRLVVEGTPDELKRDVGADVIVATVEPDCEAEACAAVSVLPGVSDVTVNGTEVTVSTGDGARLLSPVATSLDRAGVAVSSLTMRTPTLDDVFLHHTGSHLE